MKKRRMGWVLTGFLLVMALLPAPWAAEASQQQKTDIEMVSAADSAGEKKEKISGRIELADAAVEDAAGAGSTEAKEQDVSGADDTDAQQQDVSGTGNTDEEKLDTVGADGAEAKEQDVSGADSTDAQRQDVSGTGNTDEEKLDTVGADGVGAQQQDVSGADVSDEEKQEDTGADGTEAGEQDVFSTTGMLVDSETETENLSGAVSAKKGKFETNDFEFSVNCGLEGNYRSGVPLPVTVTIKSKNEDFSGVLRIVAPQEGSSSIAYEKEVLLSAGSEKSVTMSVYDTSSSSLLYLQLDDEKGRTVIDKKIRVTGHQNDRILVGVLSNNYSALNYFDQIDVSINSKNGYSWDGQSQLVELNWDMFPEDESGLEMLSFLLITEYDSSLLEEAQIRAITSWVERGGVLILGTGTGGSQVMSALGGLASVQVGNVRTGELKIGEKSKNSIKYSANDGIFQISLKDGKAVEGILTEKKLIWEKEVGEGLVLVSAAGFGMNPVAGWKDNNVFAKALLNHASVDESCASRIVQLNNSVSNMIEGNVNEIQALFGFEAPNMGLILLIVLLFLISGPILYLILKLLDKRGLIWILIPGMAGAFTAAIFLSTMNLRIRHPQTASVTCFYDEDEEDAGKGQVMMSVMSPAAKTSLLQYSQDLTNIKVIQDWDYDVPYKNEKYMVAIREGSDGYETRINNRETFNKVNMTFDYKGEVDVRGQLQTDLKRTLTGFKGKITNHSGRDFKKLLLLTNSQVQVIGDLKAGESVEIDDNDQKKILNLNTFYGYYEVSVYKDLFSDLEEDGDDSEIIGIASVYQMLAQNATSGSTEYDSACLMGMIDGWDADYVKDDKVEEINIGMYYHRMYVPVEGYEDSVFINMGEAAQGGGDVGEWDPYDGEMYRDTVDETFDLSEQTGKMTALLRRSRGNDNYVEVKVYAKNVKTGKYEELFEDSDVMEFADGCPYMNKKGEIKMRFKDAGGVGRIPMLFAVFSEVEEGGEQ